MIQLSIVILNHNTKEYLRRALRSVKYVMKNSWEVIVIDNASTDGSPEMVKAEFPFVKLFRLTKNVGFSAGNNVGIKRAQGTYIMLLNSDTELRDGQGILGMMAYMDAHPDVGVITPKVMLEDNGVDMASHRGAPTPWNAVIYFMGLEKLFGRVPLLSHVFGGYHQTWKNMSEPHEIDACTAAAMLVRATAIDEVGLLDEMFFMYGEDLDWCVRFRKAGWKIVFYPGAIVLHYKHRSGMRAHTDSATALHAKKQATSSFFDTMELYYRKHYGKTSPEWFSRLVRFGVQRIRKMKGVV